MGKKRERNTTVYCSVEGQVSETSLLSHIKSFYSDSSSMKFPENPVKGGHPDNILAAALKYCHFDRCFAWIDEDKDLSEDIRGRLAAAWCLDEAQAVALIQCPLKDIQATFNPTGKRKPTLVVSSPVCVESLILKIAGVNIPHGTFDVNQRSKQISDCKNAVNGLLLSRSLAVYLAEEVSKEVLDAKRLEIPELDLLIKMVSKT